MPTQSTSSRVELDIGTVRIPASDLIARLEKIKDASLEIKASNNGLTFHDLKDIKDHPELFFGAPTLNIGEISIHFGTFGTSLNIWNTKDVDKNTLDLAHNLAEFLKNYRSRLFDFFTHKSWVFLFLGPIYYALLKLSDNNLYQVILALGILLPLILYMAFCAYYYYQKPVSHVVRETFWQKNRRAILVGVLIATISGLLGYFIKQIIAQVM
ncbi:MAG: hypothetical protein JKY25_07955 [Robiginitomaculum sp.]|nr:hypothetical protein [Robiginitomaculum sp.]